MSRPFRLTHPQPSEWQDQASLFRWAELAAQHWPELHLMYAVPNGAHLVDGPRQAQQLKATGLKPGVLDVCLPVPRLRTLGVPLLLAVHDGGGEDVAPLVAQVGIFVGGSTGWKLDILPTWGALPRESIAIYTSVG